MSSVLDNVTFADLVGFPEPSTAPPLDRPDVDAASVIEDQKAWRRDGVLIKRKFIPDAVLDPYIVRRAAYRPDTWLNVVG